MDQKFISRPNLREQQKPTKEMHKHTDVINCQ